MAYGEYEPLLDADGNTVILGKGSFGKVYLVRKAKLGRRYALKLLGHEHLDRKSSAYSRFLREVSTFADLRHTHIVNIADYGECAEGTYYVMDYCEGGSLETLVRNLRPFSVLLTLRLLDKAAAALEYAHSKGLIHRDIKPENLMLLSPADRDDDLPDLIRLIDFGLAKDLSEEPAENQVSLTLESQIIGTPLYMSPEQLAGSHVDHRADIFSLGITAWYLLAGPQAFAALHNGTLIRQDRFSPLPYSSRLPDRLTGKARAVIARMIEKEESRRFQDYRGLREALRAAMDEEQQHLLSPSEPRGPRPPPLPRTPGHEFRYTALAPMGRDPATGGALWAALTNGRSVQLVTAPGHLAPVLSQLLGRLDVPEKPASVVPYERAAFSPHHPDFPGNCVCTTHTPSGPDLLSVIRNRRRITLEEGKGILQQIAEAMDFARPREIALLFSPGEIRLPGLSAEAETTEFSHAEVRLFPTLLSNPSGQDILTNNRDATLGATLVQDGGTAGAGVPTQRDFAALIYRVLAGREIDPGAFHSARNYKGIGSLQAKTDAIIRDIISGTYPAQSCRALLLTLCSSESIRLPERPQLAPLPPSSSSPPSPALSPFLPDAVTATSASVPPPLPVMPGQVPAVSGTVIQEALLTEPPLWKNLPNAARRQLVSCLRDTWDLRGDIDKDHTQATCYSTQTQSQIQQTRYAIKEAEEAARDIESCRRTLQDCYSRATQAIHQIRDSTDPAQAEIRKKDVYTLLEIAEQARRDADSHFDFLARLAPRREALLHQAEEVERQARDLRTRATQPLPEVPIILLDAVTRDQCEEVGKETAEIGALAATAMPMSAAAGADSLYGIENVLAESRAVLARATARWDRIRSSVVHLEEKLRQFNAPGPALDPARSQQLAQIRGLLNAGRFSAESAARFERDVSALMEKLSPTRPDLRERPEAETVRQCAREAAAAAERLEEIAGEADELTNPARLRLLLDEALAAKESAATALGGAGAAQREFNRAAKETGSEKGMEMENSGSGSGSGSALELAASSETAIPLVPPAPMASSPDETGAAAMAEVSAATAVEEISGHGRGRERRVLRVAASLLVTGLLGGGAYVAYQNAARPPAAAGVVAAAAVPGLPARLAFGNITEKGNPAFHPEALLTFTVNGRTSAAVPVSSNEKVTLALGDAERAGGSPLQWQLSAPGFESTAPATLGAGLPEEILVPAIELTRLAEGPPKRLPAALNFSVILPPAVTVSDGTTGLTLTSGQTLALTEFKTADPLKPLSLTFSAEGYQPLVKTVVPAAAEAAAEVLGIELPWVTCPFTWKSEVPGWFSTVRLTRLDAPEDPRVERAFELTAGAGRLLPAGRYEYHGQWGRAALRLGGITLTSAPAEAVLKWPLPSRLQWNGAADLNPLAVLDGPTAFLKPAAASWRLSVPVPWLLDFQPGGAATLRVVNPRITQLAVIGLLAGSVPKDMLENSTQVSKIVQETVFQSLVAETNAGKSVGEWFGGFWQAQGGTKLSKSEGWRTSVFLESQNETAFLTGVLASADPWHFLGNPQYQALQGNFFETTPLQVESIQAEGLRLTGRDQSVELMISPDGRTGKWSAPGGAPVELKAR